MERSDATDVIQRVHNTSVVIDGSTVMELSDDHRRRTRAGGVTAVNHTVTRPYVGTAEALQEINACRRWIDAQDDVILATTASEIEFAKERGLEAVIFGPQDTEMIGRDRDLLGTFYDLGVRILQLTYQRQNLLGSGCGEATDAGLSESGRLFVQAMDELGILIDVSHCGERTGYEAMAASTNPVLVTHSFCDALSPHIRAKSDDFIRALGDQGGVMGITTLSGFLYYPDNKTRRPDLKRFVEHVARVADLAGVDAVAVATDYDETLTYEMRVAQGKAWSSLLGDWAWEDRRAIGMDDAADFPNITVALSEGGFSDEEIAKILGGNWLRVFNEVCG